MPEKKHFLDNSSEYFHTLHLVFYLMVSIPLILFCLVYLDHMKQGGLSANLGFSGLHALVTLGVIFASGMAYFSYRQRYRHYNASVSFRERLRFFHQTAWRKYGWLEVANLLPVLGLYLLAEQFFVGVYAVALVLFSINRPTFARVADDLQLDDAERTQLASGQDFDQDKHAS